jgi:tetratricopeptide (TPR) repeat protein
LANAIHPGHGGELAKAESTARATVASLRELGEERNPQSVPILSDLAIILANQGKYPEALAIGRETVSLDSALFGTSHPSLATHLENLGYVYNQAGFPDSAIGMVQQVLAMRRALLAPDNPAIGRTLYNLASLENDAGAYAAAQPHYEEAARLMRQAYGPEHRDVVSATGWMGRNQFELGRYAESERSIRSVLAVTAAGSVTARDTMRFGRFLVTMLVDQRRWKEAEPLALRVFAIMDSLKEDSLARVMAGQLVAIYEGMGRGERAEEWRGRVAP